MAARSSASRLSVLSSFAAVAARLVAARAGMNECSFSHRIPVKPGRPVKPGKAEAGCLSKAEEEPTRGGAYSGNAESGFTARRTMLDDTQQHNLVTRLNRIEGQIRGI